MSDPTTDRLTAEHREIEKERERELRDIYEHLLDIRRRTGFGKIVIELKYGEIVDMEVSFRRRPKVEKKQRDEQMI